MENGSESTEKRKLAAVMFTDIKGFSKRMGEDEEGTFKLLKQQMSELKPIIQKYDGRVVKTIGDAIMGDFASVQNAVKCATEIQKLLYRTNKSRTEQEKLIIRIGIHLGDVIMSDNDLFGDGVNIAARLEGNAPPGGIAISEIVYNSVKNQLPLNYKDIGPQSLKNIKEPVNVFHIPPIEDAMRKETTAEEAVEAEKKEEVEISEPTMKFKQHLESLEIDEAKKCAKTEKLSDNVVKSLVKQSIEDLGKKQEYRKALKVGNAFGASKPELYFAITGEFQKLYKGGNFEEAAMWGLEYKLPKDDLIPTVQKYFSDLIGKNASIGEFQKFLDNFGSMKNELRDVAMREFKNLYSMERFDLCIYLGKQFGVMGKEVSEIAVKALIQELDKSNFSRVESLIKEYNVFSDNIFQPIENENTKKKLGNLFLDKYVVPRLKKGEFEDLKNKLQSFNFFKVKFYDKFLNAIQDEIIGNAVSMHNRLIENDNYKIAKILNKEFDLLNQAEKFRNKILETVEKYHNSLLKTGKYEVATVIKDEYKLFTPGKTDFNFEELNNAISDFMINAVGKGDFASVEKALKEYKISKIARVKMFKNIVIDHFKKQEFDTVFKIMDFAEVKLTEKELGEEVINSFKILLSEKKYDYAAKLSKKFSLPRLLIEDLIVKCWKLEMKKGNYETAFKIKKDFSLQKKFTDKIVRGLYYKNLQDKNHKDAMALRMQYGIKIGFGEWFKELFLKLFG